MALHASATVASLLVSLALSGPIAAQTTTLVSLNPDGTRIDPTKHYKHHRALRPLDLSPSGRFVVFSTNAYVRGARDDEWWDVFLHDRHTGLTEWISKPRSQTTTPGGDSFSPVVSDDGRFVAFTSTSTQLTVGATGVPVAYVRDRATGTVEVVDLGSTGVPGNSWSMVEDMSRDGRFVAFRSWSDDLLPNDTNGQADLFIRDRLNGTTELVNVTPWGAFSEWGAYTPSISADGRFVTFTSSAGDLTTGPHLVRGSTQILLRDRLLGVTVPVSLDPSGSYYVSGGAPRVSDDGRYVAFVSSYPVLAGDTNERTDIYVKDMRTGAILRASLDSAGEQRADHAQLLDFSGDGGSVAFGSIQSFDVMNDAAGGVFVRDLAGGSTWRANAREDGTIYSGGSTGASLTFDAGQIAFDFDRPGIVPGPAGKYGVYVYDPSLTCPLAFYCTPKPDHYGCAPRVFAGGSASLTGWDGFVIVADEVSALSDGMLFWGRAPAASPFQGGVLCVAGPLERTPVLNSGGPVQFGCTGQLSFRFSQAHMAARGLTAGSDVYAQFWYRAGSPPFDSVGLSNAIRFRVCP